MPIEYKLSGEVFFLDDSKGCYIEVTHKEQKGYVGVNLNGTADLPYGWIAGKGDGRVTSDGLNMGQPTGVADLKDCLNYLCDTLLRNQKEADAREAFNPEEACHALHDFTKQLND